MKQTAEPAETKFQNYYLYGICLCVWRSRYFFARP